MAARRAAGSNVRPCFSTVVSLRRNRDKDDSGNSEWQSRDLLWDERGTREMGDVATGRQQETRRRTTKRAASRASRFRLAIALPVPNQGEIHIRRISQQRSNSKHSVDEGRRLHLANQGIPPLRRLFGTPPRAEPVMHQIRPKGSLTMAQRPFRGVLRGGFTTVAPASQASQVASSQSRTQSWSFRRRPCPLRTRRGGRSPHWSTIIRVDAPTTSSARATRPSGPRTRLRSIAPKARA